MNRRIWIILGLLGLLVLLQVLSLRVGSVSVTWEDILETLSFAGDSDSNDTHATIIWQFRWQRILLGTLVGVGLGAAGAGYQGLFRNPLADPFVIGAASGAALGVACLVVFGGERGVMGPLSNATAGLLGALAAVWLVYTIASLGSHVSVFTLLLAGVAVSSFAGALVSLLMFLNDREMAAIFHWILGSLARPGGALLPWITLLMAVGILSLWSSSRVLDALTFGEETAASLGVNLTTARLKIVVSASLATAAAVAAAGTIGFVGLVAPHLARQLVGARHGYLIPASALLGAILLIAADDLARSIAAPAELPVGVVTALLGSPFFLLLLRSTSRQSGGMA
ncbi:MAG: iron ABC transporter permease [Planctomycetaceae bacterium]|nr:iron ABC transporter permease [Planctomycetaceae bacterium]